MNHPTTTPNGPTMTTLTTTDRDAFVRGFIIATLWANSYGDTPTGEAPVEADESDLTPEDRGELQTFALAFLDAHADDLAAFAAFMGRRGGFSAAGHDLALTGAGHGAGFWDRGAGDLGDHLSEAARGVGYFSVHVADDGSLSIVEG